MIWAAIAGVALLLLVALDAYRIIRIRDNGRAIDAERIARENAAPLGNVERLG